MGLGVVKLWLKFESTSTIQSRVLAEFIAEWTLTHDEEVQETTLPGKEADRDWIMYFDGAFLLQGAGAGVLLVAPTGEHLNYVVQMHFPGRDQRTTPRSMSGCLPVLGSRWTWNQEAHRQGRLAACRQASQQGLSEPIDGGLRR